MAGIVDELAERLVSELLAEPGGLRGCTAAEIAQVESTCGVALPEIYRDWLRVMGRAAGEFLEGSDAFYPTLLELRGSAEELLAENGNPFSLPPGAFVFLMHQGYQFLFFHTSAGDSDPPVYHYLEGEETAVERWPRLSAYWMQVLDDHLRLRSL